MLTYIFNYAIFNESEETTTKLRETENIKWGDKEE